MKIHHKEYLKILEERFIKENKELEKIILWNHKQIKIIDEIKQELENEI